MSEAITIPHQLISSEARFVKVRAKSKAAFETAWEQHTYQHDDPDLMNWFRSGGNYGVVSHNGVGTLDIDDLNLFKSLGLVIPDTFTDCREDCRFHVFFKCENIPDEYKQKKVITPWGDIRFPGHNSYVVGTGCIAPNKSNELKPYVPYNNAPIRTLEWTVIEGILKASGKDTSDTPEIILIDKKKPFEIPPLVKQRHPTITSSVGVMVRAGFTYDAVESAIIEENKHFEVPKTLDVLKRETLKAWQYCTKKQVLKEADKERVKVEKVEAVKLNETDDGIRATAYWLSGKYLSEYPLVRFNVNDGAWYFYNGKNWEKDEKFHIHSSIMGWSQKQYQLVASGDSKEAHLTVDLLRRIHTRPDTLDPVMKLRCAVLSSDFDADDDVINCQNGTLDTHTWELRGHHQDDLCRCIANANFDESATCPKWMNHIKFMFNNNQALMDWFQCFCGYMLRLGNPAQMFVILYGKGENGKSVANLTLHHVMGSYAHTTSPQTFHSKKYDDCGTANPALCDCEGKRLISCSEAKEGALLDSGIVKATTGGDPIEARYLHQNPFRFFIHGTLVYLSNHSPRVRDMSDGMWRRLFLVPFTQKVKPEDKILLYEKHLIPEADGIFLWMVNGLKKFDTLKGFPVCKEITEATTQYRTDNDIVGQYIQEHCLSGSTFSCRLEEITKDCLAFCMEMGVQKISKRAIRTQIQERGFCKNEPRQPDGWYIGGIKITAPFIKTQTLERQEKL